MASAKLFPVSILVFLLTAGAFGQEPGTFSSTKASEDEAATAEEHYLGYEALSEAARSIASVIRSRRPGSLIVCGKSDCQNLIRLRLLYELFKSGSDRIIKDYDDPRLQTDLANIIAKLSLGEPKFRVESSVSPRAVPDAVSEALEAWTGVIGQANTSITEAAKLINSLIKTDVTVTSSVIKASNSHLTTSIASQFSPGRGTRVYLPEYEQMENVNVIESNTYVNYVSLRRILYKGQRQLTQIERLLEVSAAASGLTPDELAQIAKLEGLVRNAKELLIISVAQSLEEDDDGDTAATDALILDLKALETLIKAERFSTELRSGAMILSVDIVKVLGTRIEKKNLILGIRNRFSGSATVQYVLTDSKGNLIFADTAVIHTGSRKLSNIRNGGRVP